MLYEKLIDDENFVKSDEVVYVWFIFFYLVMMDLKNWFLFRMVYGEYCMSYLLKLCDYWGKFDFVIVKVKGVELKDFKRLIDGEILVIMIGEIVMLDMVVGLFILGRGVVIVDIFIVDFVDVFFDWLEWIDVVLMDNIVVIYWLFGKGLYNNFRILEYMWL